MKATYRLRFFFEWGPGSLWADNEAAYERFGVGPIEDRLQLAPQTLSLCQQMSAWHIRALNWDSPVDPGPWRQPECDEFNRATEELLNTIRLELGEDFDVLNHQEPLREDPDLDAYLADPKGFRRTQSTSPAPLQLTIPQRPSVNTTAVRFALVTHFLISGSLSTWWSWSTSPISTIFFMAPAILGPTLIVMGVYYALVPRGHQRTASSTSARFFAAMALALILGVANWYVLQYGSQ